MYSNWWRNTGRGVRRRASFEKNRQRKLKNFGTAEKRKNISWKKHFEKRLQLKISIKLGEIIGLLFCTSG